MKKQLIAAAVAASMSAVAMADISITGNANYEYFHNTVGGAVEGTNASGDMEVNLSVVGKSGDTSVVANLELSGASADTTGNRDTDGELGGLDIEDLYITTKIGDINVKAGDFASGTTALGGEIDNGSRVFNKVDLSTKIGSATVGYAVNSASGTDDDMNGSDAVVYASMPVAGVNLSIKDQSDSYTIVGISGEQSGINFRIENKDSDSANSDVLFYDIGTKIGDLNISYAAIDADSHNTADSGSGNLIGEDDSTVFAQDAHDTGLKGINQVTIGTSMDGTAVKLRAGTRQGGTSYQDSDFMEVSASRPLASGATMTVTYSDWENVAATSATKYDNQTLEIDLSVKF
jgi:hypothetical protein